MATDADPAPRLHSPSPASADNVLPMDVTRKGDWTILRPREVSLMDPAVIEALNAHVERILDEGHTRLILDFQDVQYISSSMIGVLVGTRQSVTKAGGELVLCAFNPRLQELLKITRLDKMFQQEKNVEAVLNRQKSKE